jgi:hypothetical protein
MMQGGHTWDVKASRDCSISGKQQAGPMLSTQLVGMDHLPLQAACHFRLLLHSACKVHTCALPLTHVSLFHPTGREPVICRLQRCQAGAGAEADAQG